MRGRRGDMWIRVNPILERWLPGGSDLLTVSRERLHSAKVTRVNGRRAGLATCPGGELAKGLDEAGTAVFRVLA